ncbi:MAG: alpha-L-fucosidase [Armatimonadota bacterium]
MRRPLFVLSTLLLGAALALHAQAQPSGFTVSESADEIRIASQELEAVVKKRGYVSGVAGGSFVDRKTGARDAGFGLDIVDWIMEPGSDAAYRDQLQGDLAYDFNNAYHGKIPKRSIEGPQICTQAKEVRPEVIRGRDFVAVKTSHRYTLAAPGKKPGSLWEQTLVFPKGKRYFLSSDRITTANPGQDMFLRLDMPGHIKHQDGDTFSEVYLSYAGRIPASEFKKDFAPDEKLLYRRGPGLVPQRFIRAYHLRDPKTGKDGPWLAGMTLDPSVVHEAWCHQRGYVCMIQEFGLPMGHPPLKAGDTFSAAFLVGYFDSIDEMHRVYDQYAGHSDLRANARGWKLVKGWQPERPTLEQRLSDRLEWFQDQKLGFFVHWGAYSQWGCIESWPLVEVDKWARPDDLPAWVERGKDMERFKRDYWALPRTFNPTRFDPQKWADAAKGAGMKYFVFTTKHHDGFSMWDTRQTDYRITGPETPFRTHPRADVVRHLFDTFRKEGFGIGAYFSKADWHHPDYWSPHAPAPTRHPNYDTHARPDKWSRFTRFVHNQIEELMSGYGPIDILWLDAGQVRPPDQDIRMDDLVRMARGYQPNLIVVDRTVGGPHENYHTPEQTVPDRPLPYVWESCITMGDQWSYKPDDRYKSPRELVHLLVDVVAKGGNLLLNVGPQPDGELPPPALERMRAMGDWLRVNGKAIYGTRPVAPYKEGRVAFTRKGDRVYGIYLAAEGETAPPAEITLRALRPRPGSPIRMLGGGTLEWTPTPEGATIRIPERLRRQPPCEHAFAFELTPEG